MKDTFVLEQKSLVESYLNRGPRPLSSYSFVSVFAWCDFFDFEFRMIKDSLCIFATGASGSFLYLPPLGKVFDLSTVEEVFRHLGRQGGPRAVHRIENIPGNLLPVFGGGGYNQFAKNAEYVYRKEDLIALKGNAYKSQRHDCNYFKAHHADVSFLPYTDEDFSGCMDLYERWAAGRARTNSDGVYQSMLQENRLVHARLLRKWKALGLVAGVLKADGKCAGYSFGYAVDESTFCVYAEIADLQTTGGAAYMFRSLCSDSRLAAFGRINTMDDFAMPNVERAKQAYHPSEMIASYAVSQRI
ncbi:MAG: DUF2156 domain-containing protein [Candidatus Omnitrophica bacterium]|nr:DUF2156 domain-containing protein [Candidatus Omnitrophota bacterium]MDE2215004.1 DUF2156 domain-containing protein [Candidatus Omnitrophota bacterium]MDE2232121.1 DUF2156 domain-containing protein [Candidatus Omnitrophota bacterium]